VKISDDERGGWSSDRPRRNAGPARPPDVSVRSSVLRPAERLRYSPGSLLVVVSTSPQERDRFVERVVEERSAILSLAKVRRLLAGRVADEDVAARAREVLEAAVAKRLQANETVVVMAETLDPAERERYVRIAAAAQRPRHVILLEAGAAGEEDRPVLADLRRRLMAGELGAEGFNTALRLSGTTVAELKRIVFQPAPRDDD
jgi:hypothetical protein